MRDFSSSSRQGAQETKEDVIVGALVLLMYSTGTGYTRTSFESRPCKPPIMNKRKCSYYAPCDAFPPHAFLP
jgi:hypothetical protein